MSKTTRRTALGRGLAALIPVEESEASPTRSAEQIDISSITPNPFQPRTHFDQEEIKGLAESIKNQGLLQPIVVRKKVNGYEIISGERRFRALKQLGWDYAPCIVKAQVTDREMLELALVENIQREDLSDIEEALAYQRLLLECSLSHEQLSERIGKSRSAITNTLRLLKLPESVQSMIQQRAISPGHARALLAIDDASTQKVVAQRVVSEGLSVRQVEEFMRDNGHARPKAKRASAASSTARPVAPAFDADTTRCLEELQYRFGTAVRINGSNARGRIEVHYSGAEDLTRILNLMLPTAG
jgi:ParB family transcriptional regulator, chromosome partitioning protein